MRNSLYYILFFSLLFFIGCSKSVNRYKVRVDAVALSSKIPPSTFYIEPLDSNVDELKFRRHSMRLAKILIDKGYIQTDRKELAEQIIYFGYGIKEIEKRTEIVESPDVSFGFSWGIGHPFHRSRFYSHIFWDDLGYRRYRAYSKVYRLYNRYITIISKDRNGKELWRVDVESIGESNDIDSIVPILLKVVPDYIGKSLDKPIVMDIDENLTKK